MAKSEIRDMTTGSPFRLILGFAVPMLMGLLFQQFYSMVDTIIVGKYLGVSALASVGSTSSINFMIIGFCTGVCSGFSIPVAQRFGAGDHHGLRCFVANAGWLSAIFSAVMTIIVCFLCMDILRWMDTPDDIIQGAYDYIFIIFAGIPVTYLYNILFCGINLRGGALASSIAVFVSPFPPSHTQLNHGNQDYRDLAFALLRDVNRFTLKQAWEWAVNGRLLDIHAEFFVEIATPAANSFEADETFNRWTEMYSLTGVSDEAIFTGNA